MKFKVSDFLICDDRKNPIIGVVKNADNVHGFYELCIIGVNRLFSSSPDTVYQTTANFSEWELEEEGWEKFDPSMIESSQ
jgi:hypothetical protein